MADNRKEVERAELHRTIWAIADDLRGSVDGWLDGAPVFELDVKPLFYK